MTKTYQANYFTGQQLDEHMKKVLDKSIAGAGLTMDEQGVLHCSAPGYGKLLKSYTHSTNKEAHPTAVDLATGYFTAQAHGLTENQLVFVAIHEPYHLSKPYQYLPGGLLIGEVQSRMVQRYYTRVIDENTFALSTAKSGEILTYTENSTMDLTKFHIEVYTSTEVVLDGLPDLTEALIVVEGRTAGACRMILPDGYINDVNKYGVANFDDTVNPNTPTILSASAYGDSYIGYNGGWGSVHSEIEFKYIGHRHLLMTKTEDTLCFDTDNKGAAFHTRTYMHRAMEADTFNEITLNTFFAPFNGLKIELYAKS